MLRWLATNNVAPEGQDVEYWPLAVAALVSSVIFIWLYRYSKRK